MWESAWTTAASASTLANNLVLVRSGSVIEFTHAVDPTFASNYNLFWPATPSAGFGSVNGQAVADLAAWRALTATDADSLVAQPLFVDLDGADNRFGQEPDLLRDTGLDDNFVPTAGSPTIDRGTDSSAPPQDILGLARSDDPGTPNVGLDVSDIGAFEFNGSTLDVTPPVIVEANGSAGTAPIFLNTPVEMITVSFGEPVNPIDANAPSNYDLRSPGLNGRYDDLDDVVFTLDPEYVPGDSIVRLFILDGPLSAGEYRLTVAGDESIHDLSGNKLDGDGDGRPGGNYVRLLAVDLNSPTAELIAPAPGGAIDQDLGFVDVRYTDFGVSGIDSSSIGTDDLTISGVSVDRVSDLGSGMYRYHYHDDGQMLAPGSVEIVVNPGAVVDKAGNAVAAGTLGQFQFTPSVPTVVGRLVFYNNSAFDVASDDGAIAVDKQALLPGQSASFANYTSYSRGINGLMIDIADLPVSTLTADDFQFRVGNNDDPSAWPAAPAPATISVRRAQA